MKQKQQKTCLLATIRPSPRSINDLPDVLLSEIISRVPNYESVLNCKLVCKLWHSLISCEDFASCFITNHAVQGEYQKHVMLVQIAQHVPLCINFLGSQEPEPSLPRWSVPKRMSRWHWSMSRCVSTYRDRNSGEKESIRILASHNDLFLCSAMRLEDDRPVRWFVYNPFTKERLALPPPPLSGSMGLMGEPCYVIDAQGRYHPQGLNQRWFKIVCIRYSKEQGISEAVHFCSETGRWSDPVGMDYTFDEKGTNVVGYKGKFYWMGRAGDNTHIVVYDPSAAGPTRYCFNFLNINIPTWAWSGRACFGVCNGDLRIMRLFRHVDRRNDPVVFTLFVWELKDDGEKRWSLEKCLPVDHMTFENSRVLKIISISYRDRRIPSMVAFDPTNEDIVYMALRPFIVSFNLRTRNRALHTNIPSDMIFCPTIGDSVFPLSLPWWPT